MQEYKGPRRQLRIVETCHCTSLEGIWRSLGTVPAILSFGFSWKRLDSECIHKA